VTRLVLWAMVAVLAALNAWRAYTLAFTIDEAFSYLNFSSRSTAVTFESFHSNHHVLFTILSKLAWKAFGVSEFTLRLPSVLAGLVFLVAMALFARELSATRGTPWSPSRRSRSIRSFWT
jgi:4-amino-4-deoxy-L-arabinose transferase-like glycosyltransferase